ncbi:MAG: thiosulfate oxidation carrier complex protein SoxZ [Salinarimonas sp.]
MSRPRVRLPRSASAGEVIEIRTLIDHPMITGLSSPEPRDMLERLEVRMNGEPVFTYDFDNGSSANPYHVFFVRIEETSDFSFVWTHEDGDEFTFEGQVSVG